MSQSSRARRAYVAREDAGPRRAAPRTDHAAQSNSRPARRAGVGPPLTASGTRLTRRGIGVLAGVVTVALVAAGAYAVPRLSPAQDRALSAFPGSTAAGLDPAPTSIPTRSAGAADVPQTKQNAPDGTATPSGQSSATAPELTKVTVPATGPGSYHRATERVASATSKGKLYRFDVHVEKNLDIDANQAALAIAKTLNDKRSWRGTGRWRFQLVPVGQPADLHAYIVTPGTTDKLCAPLLTQGEVSCRAGNKIVLNAKRWLRGADAYGDDIASYREYQVNHEFGHALGHGHLGCPKRGDLAPVMLQQTKGLQGCRKNPWPMATGGD